MNELKPEDVMRALEICTDPDRDCDCPFKCPFGGIGSCEATLKKYSFALLREKDALIAKLTQTNAEKDAEIEKLKQEHKDYIEDVTALLSEKNTKCEKIMRENAVYANGVGKVDKNYHQQGRAEAITEFAKELTSELIKGGIYPVFVKGAIERTEKKLKGATDGKSDL